VCVAAAQFADGSQARTPTEALDHVKSGCRRRRPAGLLVAASDVLDQGSSVEVCRRQSVSGFSFETAEGDVDAGKSGSEAVLGHIWSRALQRRCGRRVSTMQAVVE